MNLYSACLPHLQAKEDCGKGWRGWGVEEEERQ